jgi:hypothetical protein
VAVSFIGRGNRGTLRKPGVNSCAPEELACIYLDYYQPIPFFGVSVKPITVITRLKRAGCWSINYKINLIVTMGNEYHQIGHNITLQI